MIKLIYLLPFYYIMALELDVKDKKILFELDKNSRISLSGLAKKVRLSKEVVFHRINNLQKRGIILRYQTVISTYRLGYQGYKLYFKLQNVNQEVKTRMQEFLIKNKMVFWFANCQGRWDLIVACWAKSIQDFDSFEDEILNNFSNYIQEKQITISRRTMQFNRRWFAEQENPEIIETNFGEGLEEIKIDKIDEDILRNLANNARMKITDLANKAGVSVTVARYRLKQLEKSRLIIGYKYALNTKILGYETCKAFVYFKNMNDEKKRMIETYLKFNKNVINYVFIVGSWDMEIELEARNFDEYYKIMSDIQEKHGEIIKGYESVLFSSEPKQSFMPGAYPASE